MLSLLLQLCDSVFRERNDHKILRKLSIDDLRQHLSPTMNDDFVFLLPFSEPCVRAVIHEAKFHGNEKAWDLLGQILADYIRHFPKESKVVPIPLSKLRRKKRGYNQVEKVAEHGLKDTTRHHLYSDLLYRKRDTVPQTTLSRKERLKNVKDAFDVRMPSGLKDSHIIILDDVATTGATLKAAEASLRPHHPASITLLALAH